MAQVSLEQVSREFPGGVRALDALDLEVADGELLVLVGPSGSGKTTTLRLIAGLERATSGTVRIAGRVVNDVAPRKRDVAMVFQHPALYPHLNVYGNLAFGRGSPWSDGWLGKWWHRMVKPTSKTQEQLGSQSVSARLREAAATMGIERLLDRLPAELSGGEQQRVAVAKALLRRPAVFLFDEPLSHLDAQLRVEMRRELKQLHRRTAGTMIYVTHDQVEAMTLGDRIAVLDHGRLQQVGTPTEVYDRPANRFVAGFVGTPGMSFCVGRLRLTEVDRDAGSGGTVVFQVGAWSIPMPMSLPVELMAYLDRPIVLGLRSSDVHLRPMPAGVDGAGVEAEVALVEPLGDAKIVHLEWGRSETAEVPATRAAAENCHATDQQSRYLACQAGADAHVAAGDRVRVGLDLRRAYWFDPKSGANVCPRSAVAVAENPAA
jgi:multiple sugar transport system ATP-binding protein